MATLYRRKNRLWIAWFEGGQRRAKSTGLLASEWEAGLKLKAATERELEARKRLGLESARTLGAFKKLWLQRREEDGYESTKDDAHRMRHFGRLDAMPLDEVTPEDVRDLVQALKRKGLAPRSIRHVYSTLRLVFKLAKRKKLVAHSPCDLERGELPKKKDKNPAWRATAVFTREEVEALLSDARVPEPRRVLYAVLLLAGPRIGEAAALRWRHYDAKAKPLGRLLVAASFSRKKRKEKGTKTDNAREVPVHRALAKVLAGWKLGGWQRLMKRAPTQDDLLLPNRFGNNLRDPVVYRNLHRDLATLGFRPRRTHDTRRTFISLALADGAQRDILKLVTHGHSGDVMDLYSTLPFHALCAEVAKLEVRLKDTASPKLHRLTPGGRHE